MTLFLVIISCIILIALIYVAWRITRPAELPPAIDPSEKLLPTIQLLQNQMMRMEQSMHERMESAQNSMHDQFTSQTRESRSVIESITEKLARLDETNKQVVGFTEQLRSFQDILKNPKQRGILGEYYLETVLRNVLPPDCYSMQYGMPDGTIADAVVFVDSKIVPIDSKFSLENYNRIISATEPTEKSRLEKLFVTDLKTRITETAKYIQPGNGTMDFAFMFIPHEAIYYDLLINKIGAMQDEDTESLIERAARKYHVIIVSPTSFLAYLQTVLQGLRAMKIEQSAREIRKNIEELGKHLKSYEEYHNKIGSSLATVVNHYTASGKEFKKIDKDILRITEEKIGIDIIDVEKPSIE
jgi:DNA recombination protein RmuC